MSLSSSLWDKYVGAAPAMNYAAFIQMMKELYCIVKEREGSEETGAESLQNAPQQQDGDQQTRPRSHSGVSTQSSHSSASVPQDTASHPQFIPPPHRIQITPQELQHFRNVFTQVSEGNNNVTLDQVKSTFKESRLDPGYLWAVWQLCDVGAKQHLTEREFMYAMFFIERSRRGGGLVPLPPQGIPQGDIEVQQEGAPQSAPQIRGSESPSNVAINAPQPSIAPPPISTSLGFDDDFHDISPATDASGMVSSAAAHAAQTRVNELLQETRMINQDMFRINQLSEMSKAQYDEMKSQANTLQQALQSYQQDIERVLRERRQVQSELYTMRAQVVLMRKDKEAFAEQMTTLQQQIEEARREKSQLSEERANVEASLSETRNSASAKSRELELLNMEVAKLRAEVEMSRSQSSNASLGDVQQQIDSKQQELNQLRQENQQLQQRVQQSQSKLNDTSKKLNTELPNDIKEEQRRHDALMAQLREAEAQLLAQESTLDVQIAMKLKIALRSATLSLADFDKLLNNSGGQTPPATPTSPAARQLPEPPKRMSKELPAPPVKATATKPETVGQDDDFYVDEDEFGDDNFGAAPPSPKRALPTPPVRTSSSTSFTTEEKATTKQLPTPPPRTDSGNIDVPPPVPSTKQLPPPPVAREGSTKKLPTPPVQKAPEVPTHTEPETPSGFGEFESFGKTSAGFEDFENAFNDDNAFESAFNDFEEDAGNTGPGVVSKNDPFANAFGDEEDADDWGDF